MNIFLCTGAVAVLLATVSSFAYAGDNQGMILDDSTYMTPPTVEPRAGDESAYGAGFYIGADLGYNWGNFDADDTAGVDGDVDLDGVQGGLFFGYGFSHPFSSFTGYLGFELGFEWSDADDGLDIHSYEKNYNFLATLRPGVVIYDGTSLLYGVLGYSRAELEGAGHEDDVDGFVAGAGAEIGAYNGFKVRFEYNYVDYEDASLNSVSLEGNESTLKAGVLYRF